MLQSLTNKEIKFVKSLANKKFRDEHKCFIVEGEKLVQEGLDSDFELIRIYRSSEIGQEAMSRISLLKSPSPILAIFRQKDSQKIEIDPQKGLYLALDNISDPGNLGTIIRLADWFGIAGIFASKQTVELYNPKVVQATMGAIFRTKIEYCDLAKPICRFQEEVYGCFLQGKSIYESDFSARNKAKLIVIGSEARGISSEIERLISQKITIPSFVSAGLGSESLNAAIASGIVISEFTRQIHQH